jgi:myo-inositol 2-dehydrogenase / D-chiro-inositol 1-dehydrogenase
MTPISELDMTAPDHSGSPTRRGFIKGSSMLLAGSTIPPAPQFDAQSTVTQTKDIRIGLVGCGTRGTAIAARALAQLDFPVRLVAVADAFENRMQQAIRSLRSNVDPAKIAIESRRFSGLEGYRRLLECDLDVVILATPPGFRPLHTEAAIAAGKHVFVEKPISTDVPGACRFLEAGKLADQLGLAVSVGLQRRHQANYVEAINKLQQGIIGHINFCRAYWNQGPMWIRKRTANQSELEYQLRNWYYFNWLSGDHIVEQHVHNLDVINWLIGEPPTKAQGMGGRQLRTTNDCGQIYDHHCVEFTYANGTKLLSMCRQMPGCWNSVGEFAHGSLGWADISSGKFYDHANHLIWQSNRPSHSTIDGIDHQLRHLLMSLQVGQIPNESLYGYQSTMTAIMGRMATYSGKEVTWNSCSSNRVQLADFDQMRLVNGPAPIVPDFDGSYQVPRPSLEEI